MTGNIGPHAFQRVRSFNRQVTLSRHILAGEALDKLQKGELELLSAPTVKHSWHDSATHPSGDHTHH